MEELSLSLHCTNAEQAEVISELFEGVDIVRSDANGKDFTCDWEFSFEPFEFGTMSYREYADEITDLLKELSTAVPDSGFTARYLITNDSYDGCLIAEYSYENQSLKVKITEIDSVALCDCPRCGEKFEEEIELRNHKHGQMYTCPACGEEFTFEETDYDEIELEIADESSDELSDSFTEEDEIPEDRKEKIYRSLLSLALEKTPENADDLQGKLKKAETDYKTGDLSDSLFPVNHPVYHLAGYLSNVVGICDDELENMLKKAGASQFESDYIYEMCGMFYLL